MKKIFVLDTTLRDGAQTSSVSFTLKDKIHIFNLLKDFGMDFIESGWPGANEVDTHFFKEVLDGSKTAFCMTSKTNVNPENDENLRLVVSSANHITMVGKSSAFHVTDAINTTLEKNLKCISGSIKFCKNLGKTLIFDAEHFFDGYKFNPLYTLNCIEEAQKSGADFITLCDTNGGTMPDEIHEIVSKCVEKFPEIKFGIHTHNDCELAVANTIAAVKAGCVMVQGTINGLGERCGNASLISVLPILVLKLGYDCGKINENISKITELSRKLSGILNEHHNPHLPFTGDSAFAHKGGLHASAVLKNPKLYEHITPESVGNVRKILISNQAGRSNVVSMLNDVGIFSYTEEHVQKITTELKKKMLNGFTFESADASFFLFANEIINGTQAEFYKILEYKVNIERKYNSHNKLYTYSESVIKLQIHDEIKFDISEGTGPVDAIHNTMYKILRNFYPDIKNLLLNDYKVRIIDSSNGTSAKTLVLIEFLNNKTQKLFTTVGVSENIIDASFQALNDGVKFYLIQGYL